MIETQSKELEDLEYRMTTLKWVEALNPNPLAILARLNYINLFIKYCRIQVEKND